ncbi:MAG: rRNA maturation RNase YbeY [Chitinophagaceae bacterium]
MRSASKSKLCLFYQVPVSLRNRGKLKAFIERIFKLEGRALESLNYIFCSDEDLLQINRDYLRHDYYTDIISFELSASGEPVVGEIYISVDRVRENAKNHNNSFYAELHRVIFHGALHLCGYKDKTSKHIKEMRAREDYYLQKYLYVETRCVAS